MTHGGGPESDMPTYEYVCTECANQWEEIQKISEPAIEQCPKCAKATAKRQISGGSFILKGGGWYADLYSSSSNKTSSSKTGEGGGSTSSESAPSTSASTPAAAPAAAPAASAPSGSSDK
jgi:putative FmdB family regulatory protein